MSNQKLIKEGSDGLSAIGKPVTSNSNIVSAPLPIITILDNLIDVVGESETCLFASLTEQDYQALVNMLDSLIDVVGEDEGHILASVMDFIGVLIENYEDNHVPEITEI